VWIPIGLRLLACILPAANLPNQRCAFELRSRRTVGAVFQLGADRSIAVTPPIASDSCAQASAAPAPWLNLRIVDAFLQGSLVDSAEPMSRTAIFVPDCLIRDGFG